MLKNITLSCEESLIRKAREKAQRENTSLNAIFRQWLARYIAQESAEIDYTALMERLSYVQSAGHFSWDKLNER